MNFASISGTLGQAIPVIFYVAFLALIVGLLSRVLWPPRR